MHTGNCIIEPNCIISHEQNQPAPYPGIFLFTNTKSQTSDSVVVKKKYFTQRLNGEITLDGIPQE